MKILGINAYHGNASAALVCDGKLVAAVEEERFNRVKYAAGFPAAAIHYCLKEGGVTLGEIDHVAVPRNPYARLARKLFYAMRMPSFARDRAKVMVKFTGIPAALAAAFDTEPGKIKATFHRIEHHQAHLASSFFVSPFEEAALLSADGLGDFASSMWGVGCGNRMEIDDAIAFPHSLGLYYSAVTQYLGFLKFGDEYKVMGLAAYGEPERMEAFRDIVRFTSNGGDFGFRLGLDYFTHHRTGPEMSWAEADKTPVLGKMFSEAMEKRLGGAARRPDQSLEQRHRNLAGTASAARRSLSRDAEETGGQDQGEGRVPVRGRGVQLRGEWQDFRSDAIRTGLRASGRGRCGIGRRRRVLRVEPDPEKAAVVCDAPRVLGTGLHADRDSRRNRCQ